VKQFVLPPEDEHSRLVRLTGREFHYLCVVRRYREGDVIPALTSAGVAKRLVITEIGKEYCLGRVTDVGEEGPPGSGPGVSAQSGPGVSEQSDPEASEQSGREAWEHPGGSPGNRDESSSELSASTEPRIVLCQATLKGRKLDQVVRQATEAGVDRLVPVVTDHSVSDPVRAGRGEKKVERWRTIVKEAVQQSGRPTIPQVDEPLELDELLPSLPDNSDALCLFFHESAREAEPLHKILSRHGEPPAEIWILVGPEGGLSDEEVAKLRRTGCVAGYLGPQVLRSETAALYAVAAVKTVVDEGETWALRESRDAR
jgi:16S rRNA (uracil1498-N3)-methyltransferase